jgi:putative transposase
MAMKRHKAEEIVAKLRQVDVLTSQGQSMADATRQIGVSEVTYYRWRQEFGGLKIELIEQVKRLKELELENSRLRKAVSDLTLEKLILQEAARGTSKPGSVQILQAILKEVGKDASTTEVHVGASQALPRSLCRSLCVARAGDRRRL